MQVAPRAAVAMTGTGDMIGYEASIHDLRGTLPTNGTYGTRDIEDVQGMVWHHSATTAQSIKTIAQFHTMTKGWPGIAYHFAIGWDGVIYQMHDVETVSYHAQGYNSKTIGAVLIGNYDQREMTPEMEEAAIALSEYLRDRYDLKFSWLHRDTKATACPGKYAAEFLQEIQYGPLPKKK